MLQAFYQTKKIQNTDTLFDTKSSTMWKTKYENRAMRVDDNLNHGVSHVIILKALQLELQNRWEIKKEDSFFSILPRK